MAYKRAEVGIFFAIPPLRMKRFWVSSIAGIVGLSSVVTAEAVDFHCAEEREAPLPKGGRALFVSVDEDSDVCTVGEQGVGFLPERVIDQVPCSSGEVLVRVEESNLRRADDGKLEYRATVRLRWDDQGARPIYRTYVFYCRKGV